MAKIACKEYTIEDRRKAAALFATLGSYKMVARKLGISDSTLHYWKNDDEWQATLATCRAALTDEHIQTHLNLVTKAQQVVADRLENGDTKVVAGELQRVPVSLKDAVLAMGIAQDKAQILQMKPTHISATDDRLLKLAEKLGSIARQQEARTVEGEVVSKEGVA